MERKINETFQDFKKRREEQNQQTKLKLKGNLVWDSNVLGTYKKGQK